MEPEARKQTPPRDQPGYWIDRVVAKHLESRLAGKPDGATAAVAVHVVDLTRRRCPRRHRFLFGKHHPVGQGSIASVDGR